MSLCTFLSPTTGVFIVPKWNWNKGSWCNPVSVLFRFYRTKVELKFVNYMFKPIWGKPFLSYQSGIEITWRNPAGYDPIVFIVPKWNWNVEALLSVIVVDAFLSYQSGIEMSLWTFSSPGSGSFYRTKVELKLRSANWMRSSSSLFLSYQSGIEMGFFFWAGGFPPPFLSYQSGIEIRFARHRQNRAGGVFIVPKWNWNAFYFSAFNQGQCGFYRTKVELKCKRRYPKTFC